MRGPVAREWQVLLGAVQYFTRLPVPASVGHDPALLAAAIRYLPLVGVALGLLAAGVATAALHVLPVRLAVLLSIVATIWVSGAFHEDGLADSADALGGGYDREQVLAIMKDSRVGTFGALALVLAVLVKWESLIALPVAALPAALVGAHALSRALTVAVMATLPYARPACGDSRARPLTSVGRASLAIALATGAAPLLLLGRAGLVAAAAAAVAAAFVRGRLAARLGGYTGDGLGLVQQLAELAFYLGLAAAPGTI